jgi:hypothetical protein
MILMTGNPSTDPMPGDGNHGCNPCCFDSLVTGMLGVVKSMGGTELSGCQPHRKMKVWLEARQTVEDLKGLIFMKGDEQPTTQMAMILLVALMMVVIV